ncbi:MAG: hypothetical protein KDC95_08690 [Planctomycetes bacterium]|nr:hypothetical protein [Planctomycetota bacterium]
MAIRLEYVTGSFAIVAIIAMVALPSFHDRSGGAYSDAALTPDKTELLEAVDAYHRTWQPVEKEAVLASIRDRRAQLGPALTWLLHSPRRAEFEDAIVIAREIGDRAHRVALIEVAATTEHRPAALISADRIEPWSEAELGEFATEEDLGVVCAVLEMLSHREHPPLEDSLRLLTHENESVRTAASNLFDRALGDKECRVLLQLLAGVVPETAKKLLAALRNGEQSDCCAVVETLLDDPKIEIVDAAIAALGSKRKQLSKPVADRIYAIARGARTESMDVRVRALYCLEVTNSAELCDVRNVVRLWEPLLQYFGARILLAGGDEEGIDVLLNVLERTIDDDSSMETREACFAARSLLGSLSSMHASTSLAEWRTYFRSHGLRGAISLPRPPVSFSTN